MSKFRWNDSALVPESVVINYPISFNSDGSVKKSEEVHHFELPRVDLVDFIAKSMERNFMVEKVDEQTGEKGIERMPFTEVEEAQRDLFFEYLAKSTRSKRDKEFFNGLELSANAVGALVEMFWELNHLTDILSSGGNWMLLPQIRMMNSMPEEAAAEGDSSEPQKQTLEA